MAAPDVARDAGPGPRLRSARELSGLTQQQAADHLNLDVTVVQALENDDFAALGAPVFAKGHLKRYGASLGLHEEELLDAYERVRARPEDPSLIPRARQEMAPVRSQPNWPWVFGGTALLLLAAGVVAYLSEYGLSLPFSRSPDDGAAQSAQIVAPPGPVAGANGSAESAETVAATVGGESADAAPPVAPPLPLPPGHVSISVAFAADSWAEVYDGSGKAVLYDLGQAGTQRTIAAAAPLSVTFGNAAAVRFYVNGRETAVPAPAPGNTVARFTVQSDGTLRR